MTTNALAQFATQQNEALLFFTMLVLMAVFSTVFTITALSRCGFFWQFQF